ncbi:MAG: hypothetical protein ACYDHF_07975 [Candidatus Cryosericum sp.]
MATNSAIFKKANQLMREGYPRAQAFKVAYSELGEPVRKTARKVVRKVVRKNPASGYAGGAQVYKGIEFFVFKGGEATVKFPHKYESFASVADAKRAITAYKAKHVAKNPRKKTVTRARPTTTIKLFANPKRKTQPKRVTEKRYTFVQKRFVNDPPGRGWHFIAYFYDTAEGHKLAKEYAKAYSAKEPNVQLRVYTGIMDGPQPKG